MIDFLNAITASPGYSTLCGGIGTIVGGCVVLWLNGRSALHLDKAALQAENRSLKKEIADLESKYSISQEVIATFESKYSISQKVIADLNSQIVQFTDRESLNSKYPIEPKTGLRIFGGHYFCPRCFPEIIEIVLAGGKYRCEKCGKANHSPLGAS